MTKRSLKDCDPGEIVFTTERMGDDRNSMEVREVFYIRDPERPYRYPHNVPVALLGMVQGDVDCEEWEAIAPRFMRISGPSRDPGEADGRTIVQSMVWSIWAKHPVVATALTKALK